MSKFSLISSFLLAAIGVSARLVHIKNECPGPIDLFIGGNPQGSLPSGHTVDKTFAKTEGTFIYTTSNGGLPSGARTTRAAFYGDAQSEVYYIVYDPDYLNTGVSITPHMPGQTGAFCAPAQCLEQSCSGGFNFPPVRFLPLPPNGPSPPLYACTPNADVEYTVTFCPGGNWPEIKSPSYLHPVGDTTKCLDLRGYNINNGEAVQLYDCNGSGAQRWLLKHGSTKVRLAESNWCLDAGSNPGNGVGMKIWQCYDNLPAQAWYYTQDNRIALENRGQCLDVTNGGLWSWNQMQTWQCTNNNRNQEWIAQTIPLPDVFEPIPLPTPISVTENAAPVTVTEGGSTTAPATTTTVN